MGMCAARYQPAVKGSDISINQTQSEADLHPANSDSSGNKSFLSVTGIQQPANDPFISYVDAADLITQCRCLHLAPSLVSDIRSTVAFTLNKIIIKYLHCMRITILY